MSAVQLRMKEMKSFRAGRIRSLACRFMLTVMLAMAAFLILTGCAGAAAAARDKYPMSRDLYLLDTFCQLTIYEGGGKAALDTAADALGRYDALFDYNNESSDIYRINHRTGDRVEIDADTAALLQLSEEICGISEGAFEPAIRPVTWLWDFKEEKKVPDADALEKALSQVVHGAWHVESEDADDPSSEDGKWYFVAEDPRVLIDVGAVAKGFVADRLRDVMLAQDVRSAIINLGGNVLCIGRKPDGSPFKIAIRDPRTESGYEEVLEIEDCSAVTAGIYERYFEQDGIVYHHILDPESGMPVQNGLLSVTVTGPSSGVCDALCTAIFVKGESEGKALLESYNDTEESDYRVYFIRRDDHDK